MTNKLLFVATINGESSLTKKKARTYIHANNVQEAIIGLFKRYMKLHGKANITDLHTVDKETKHLSKIPFDQQACLERRYLK